MKKYKEILPCSYFHYYYDNNNNNNNNNFVAINNWPNTRTWEYTYKFATN